MLWRVLHGAGKARAASGCVDASSEVLLECLKVGKTEFDPDGEDPTEGKMRLGHQKQTARGGKRAGGAELLCNCGGAGGGRGGEGQTWGDAGLFSL